MMASRFVAILLVAFKTRVGYKYSDKGERCQVAVFTDQKRSTESLACFIYTGVTIC